MLFNHIGIPTKERFEGEIDDGLTVAFIEVNGAPVELMEYHNNDQSDNEYTSA